MGNHASRQHFAANNFSTSYLKLKKVRSIVCPCYRDYAIAIANTLARRSDEICAPCHQAPQLLFIRGVADALSGPWNFSARASPATRFSRRVYLRFALSRDQDRAMRSVSKHTIRPLRLKCLHCASAVPLRLHRKCVTECLRGSRDEKPRVIFSDHWYWFLRNLTGSTPAQRLARRCKASYLPADFAGAQISTSPEVATRHTMDTIKSHSPPRVNSHIFMKFPVMRPLGCSKPPQNEHQSGNRSPSG